MSRYDAITAFLNRQTADEITLKFDDIEDVDVVGARLPMSARTYRQWWENQSSSVGRQCEAWMSAGWEVVEVNLGAEWVKFRRSG